jgi:hypothetical protein
MAVTSAGSGTQSCTLDTEHTLDTETTAGVYVLVLDLNALVAGDVLIARLKTKYATGGTSRLAFYAVYANVQQTLNVYSPPVPVDTEIIATIEQTDGTGRSVPWNLLRIG